MKCFFCKDEMKPGTTTHAVTLQNCVIVVRNVPCMKCEQCGEAVFTGTVMKTLEGIVNTFQNAMTEVAVVNYPERVA